MHKGVGFRLATVIKNDTIEASVYSTIAETYSNLLRALLDAVGGRTDLETAVRKRATESER
ncbi:MAG: hypothetical protein ACI8XM_000293 [Haloarculaceae archaeon]|jgi:hypothetical protein